MSDYAEMSSEIKEKCLYELNNDGTLGMMDKTSKLTNNNDDAVDEAIVPKIMTSRAPSTEQYMDMDHGQMKIIQLK